MSAIVTGNQPQICGFNSDKSQLICTMGGATDNDAWEFYLAPPKGNPSLPKLNQLYGTSANGQPVGFDILNGKIYVANSQGDSNIFTFNENGSIANFRFAGTGTASPVAIKVLSANVAFVATQSFNTLTSFNPAGVTSDGYIAQAICTAMPLSFLFNGNYVYVSLPNASSFDVFQITANGTTITKLSNIVGNQNATRKFVLNGNTLYVLGLNGILSAYDVTVPQTPVFLTSFAFDVGDVSYEMALQNNLIFATSQGTAINAVWIFDVSNPKAITKLAKIQIDVHAGVRKPQAIAVNGVMVYIFDTVNGLYTYYFNRNALTLTDAQPVSMQNKNYLLNMHRPVSLLGNYKS